MATLRNWPLVAIVALLVFRIGSAHSRTPIEYDNDDNDDNDRQELQLPDGAGDGSWEDIAPAEGRRRPRMDAKPHQFPFIVRIQIVGKRTGQVLNCTGTVLDASSILTAASCVKPCIDEDYTTEIQVGLYHSMRQLKAKLRIHGNETRLLLPEQFKKCQPMHDLCLIKTRPPIDLGPYALDDYDYVVMPDQQDVEIVGWGDEQVLQTRLAYVHKSSACENYLENLLPVMDKKALYGCSQIISDDKNICPSDNGAPLLIFSKRRKHYKIGGVLTLSPYIFGMTARSCPLESPNRLIVHTVPQYDLTVVEPTTKRPVSTPRPSKPMTTKVPSPINSSRPPSQRPTWPPRPRPDPVRPSPPRPWPPRPWPPRPWPPRPRPPRFRPPRFRPPQPPVTEAPWIPPWFKTTWRPRPRPPITPPPATEEPWNPPWRDISRRPRPVPCPFSDARWCSTGSMEKPGDPTEAPDQEELEGAQNEQEDEQEVAESKFDSPGD